MEERKFKTKRIIFILNDNFEIVTVYTQANHYIKYREDLYKFLIILVLDLEKKQYSNLKIYLIYGYV